MAPSPGPMSSAIFRICRKPRGFRGWKQASMMRYPHHRGLLPPSWVSWVEASLYDAGTAYATFDRHTFGDMGPHVFKTTDYGKTWTPIVAADSGVRGYAHVIKEDTLAPNLL